MPTLARCCIYSCSAVPTIVMFMVGASPSIISVFLLPLATGKCIFRREIGWRDYNVRLFFTVRYFVCNRNLEWKDEWLCERNRSMWQCWRWFSGSCGVFLIVWVRLMELLTVNDLRILLVREFWVEQIPPRFFKLVLSQLFFKYK